MVEEENEKHGRQQWKGRTRSNKWVFFPQPDINKPEGVTMQPGDLVHVRIEQATAWSLQGCAIAL